MSTLFYAAEVADAVDRADIVDLFAGPRGWTQGGRMIDPEFADVGLELDRWACATARDAGHVTVECNVAEVDPTDYAGAVGLIASPPCQAFSAAGKGHGRGHVDVLVDAIRRRDWTARPDKDPNVWLVLEVGRWFDALQPEWVVLEQVPAVLPLWEAYAELFDADGYSTWTGILSAEEYGAPQTRKRAVLIAHRSRLVGRPEPTHQKYVKGVARQEGPVDGLEPWLSMADALGWGMTGRPGLTLAPGSGSGGPDVMGLGGSAARATLNTEHEAGCWRVGFPRINDTGTSEDGYCDRDWRNQDEPAFVVTEKARSWVVDTGRSHGQRDSATGGQVRPVEEPAPSLTAKSGGQWHLGEPDDLPRTVRTGQATEASDGTLTPYERGTDAPAPTVTGNGRAWTFERPATTVLGDPRLHPPGHKVNADDRAWLGEEEANERYGDRAGTEALRLTIEQALILQTFPSDYPVRGGRTKQFEQIGNAVPPMLAAAILRQVLE